MKKSYLTLLFIGFTAVFFAQESKETKEARESQEIKSTKYGIRTGFNISNLDFEPAPLFTNAHRNGFFFGGFVEFMLSNSVFLNTEIQWSAEGGKDEDLRANYINLPVQLRFALSNKLTIGAGPQISLKTWQDTDGFETFTFSGVGGLEYEIFTDYFIDLRAVYGFSDILDHSVAPLEATQFMIQLGIGIKI